MSSLREQLGFGESKPLPSLVVLNGYPLAVFVAVTLHTLLLAGLLYLQGTSDSQALELVQPTVIKALLIDENPQVTNQRNQERRRVESQRREREKAAALKAQQEQREEAVRQKRREEAEAEAQRQRQVERERQQKAETEAAAKRERELREQREREAEQRRAREAAQQEQRRRDAEAAEAAAAEAASSEFELVQSATGLIQQLVTENWSRPPSARNGMRAVIQIRMLPTGELIDARITQSSGDPAFDRSAENAVYRAAPFSELTALPIRVFNQNFRTLSLIFQPEDLLN